MLNISLNIVAIPLSDDFTVNSVGFSVVFLVGFSTEVALLGSPTPTLVLAVIRS